MDEIPDDLPNVVAIKNVNAFTDATIADLIYLSDIRNWTLELKDTFEGIKCIFWIRSLNRAIGAASRFRPSYSYQAYVSCDTAEFAFKYKLKYG